MPRFRQGEDVLLVSKDDPSLNGECTVEEVLVCKDLTTYRIGIIGPTGYDIWKQSALKKKPKPSDMSFKEIMQCKVVEHG